MVHWGLFCAALCLLSVDTVSVVSGISVVTFNLLKKICIYCLIML